MMVGFWRSHDIDSKMEASTCICRVGISHAHLNEAQGSTPASRVGRPSSKVGRSDSVNQASAGKSPLLPAIHVPSSSHIYVRDPSRSPTYHASLKASGSFNAHSRAPRGSLRSSWGRRCWGMMAGLWRGHDIDSKTCKPAPAYAMWAYPMHT